MSHQNDSSSFGYEANDVAEEDGWFAREFLEDAEPPVGGRSFDFSAASMSSTSMGYYDTEQPVYRSIMGVMPQQPAMFQGGTCGVDDDMFFEPQGDKYGANVDAMPQKASVMQQDETSQKVPPHEPPALGPFIQLERTHFRCPVPAETIVVLIRNALENLDVVHVFQQDTFKFKCSADTKHGTVQYHVRIFADSNERIVECQRRNGCSIAFSLAYNSLLGEVPDLHERQVMMPFQIRDTKWGARITDAHLPTLSNMLHSDYTDVQCEGLKSLAQLSENAENSKVMLNDRMLIDAVVRQLSSSHIACQTQAAKTVGHISRHLMTGQGQKPCLQEALPPLISALCVAPTNVAVVELQRQCCLALGALANVYAAEIVSARGREALQQVAANDAVVAKRARAAMDGLATAITAY